MDTCKCETPIPFVDLIINGRTKGTTIHVRTQNLTETTVRTLRENEVLDTAKTVQHVDETCKRHGIETVVYDPWESRHIADLLERIGYQIIAKRGNI